MIGSPSRGSAPVPRAVAEALGSRGTQLDIPIGTVLTREAEPGREAFLVLAGEAEVRVGGSLTGHCGSGDLIGEIALIDGQPRTATVTATTPMTVLVFDRGEFADLFADRNSAQWVAAHLRHRLRATTDPAD